MTCKTCNDTGRVPCPKFNPNDDGICVLPPGDECPVAHFDGDLSKACTVPCPACSRVPCERIGKCEGPDQSWCPLGARHPDCTVPVYRPDLPEVYRDGIVLGEQMRAGDHRDDVPCPHGPECDDYDNPATWDGPPKPCPPEADRETCTVPREPCEHHEGEPVPRGHNCGHDCPSGADFDCTVPQRLTLPEAVEMARENRERIEDSISPAGGDDNYCVVCGQRKAAPGQERCESCMGNSLAYWRERAEKVEAENAELKARVEKLGSLSLRVRDAWETVGPFPDCSLCKGTGRYYSEMGNYIDCPECASRELAITETAINALCAAVEKAKAEEGK